MAFAGIAATATESNIFPSNNVGIVDDMFPASRRPSRYFHRGKLIAAIDAYRIACSDLFFEPVRDVPIICHCSCLPFTA